LLARELGWLEDAKQQAIADYLAKIEGLIEKAGI
jgi:hypothetical protein